MMVQVAQDRATNAPQIQSPTVSLLYVPLATLAMLSALLPNISIYAAARLLRRVAALISCGTTTTICAPAAAAQLSHHHGRSTVMTGACCFADSSSNSSCGCRTTNPTDQNAWLAWHEGCCQWTAHRHARCLQLGTISTPRQQADRQPGTRAGAPGMQQCPRCGRAASGSRTTAPRGCAPVMRSRDKHWA